MAHLTASFAAALFALCAAAADAQSIHAATPIPAVGVKLSQASDSKAYRADAARHLYDAYAHRIYRGKLPPLILNPAVTPWPAVVRRSARGRWTVRCAGRCSAAAWPSGRRVATAPQWS